MIRRILITFFQLVLIAFLAFLCKEAWNGYEQEKLNMLYEKEGAPVQVKVLKVTQEKKTWKDYIGNSKYIAFTYKGRGYNVRILQDSGWVGEGSRVWLLYHPALDLFRQPGTIYHKSTNRNVSRLINWSVVSIFNYANRWLFGAIVLGVLVVLLVCSVISKLTGWTLFGVLSDWLITLCFLCGGIFFTWDSWANHQYYNKLKTGGSVINVNISDKNKVTYHQSNRSDIPFYYYTAAVRYNNREHEIMISSEDYDRLSPGDQLTVLYNASLDDMMANDYSLGYTKIIFIGLLWIVIGYMLIKRTR